MGDLSRFALVGSFAGASNLTQVFGLNPASIPSLSSFFVRLDALQDWRLLKLEREV